MNQNADRRTCINSKLYHSILAEIYKNYKQESSTYFWVKQHPLIKPYSSKFAWFWNLWAWIYTQKKLSTMAANKLQDVNQQLPTTRINKHINRKVMVSITVGAS